MTDAMAVDGRNREEVVTATKKLAAAMVAVALVAGGIRAVMAVASTVAMALAVNCGNGRAGNGGGNRGSGGAYNNQPKRGSRRGKNSNIGSISGSSSGKAAAAAAVQQQEQIVAAAGILIAQFTRGCCSTWGVKLATDSNILAIFGICGFYYLRRK